MKNMMMMLLLLCIGNNVEAANEKVVKSTISKVTVYSQGAQICRTSRYSIGKGITEVMIEGISPKIDPKSLQVKATGNVIILDSKYTLFYPQPEETKLEGLPLKIRRSIALLEDSVRDANYTLQSYNDEIDLLETSKKILLNNGAIKGQGKVNDSMALLKEALDYYTLKMMEINKKLRSATRKKDDQTRQLNEMHARLTDLRNYRENAHLNPAPKGPVHRIVITLSAAEPTAGGIDISYLVSQAGWVPLYDLRSELSDGTINLNYKAQVFQNTGIDWENIRLCISTNNPYQNKTKPLLHPWYVDYYTYQYREQVMNSTGIRDDLRKKAELLSDGIATAPVSEEENAAMDAITSDKFVHVVDQVISAEFQIDLPYSIASNNEKHMVLVKNVDLNATYKYYAVPKYDQAAYLVAQLTTLDALQLVPARANIFFDGSYIGETYLDPTVMNDTMNLSLGKDPNIIVKRTLLSKESKEKVIGTKRERTFAYNIEVKNLKSRNVEFVVQDQIPITQNPDIEINPLELSRGKLFKQTGLIEWSFTLKAKAKKEILLKYSVKHDRDKNVPIS